MFQRTTGGARDSSDNIYNYRSINNDNTDTFRFVFYGYGFNIGIVDEPLRGLGGTTINQVLFDNPQIVDDLPTALAYTSIDTAEQFHDAYMAFLDQNFNREEVFALTRVEQTINAGSFNIVIDSSASEAFNFDGSTFTIRSSNFAGNLSTTGTVTDNTNTEVIEYSVTNTLIIPDASSPRTVDGGTIGNVINLDSGNNLIVNAINGAQVSTSNPGSGAGQVQVVNSQTINFNISFNGPAPTNYEWRIGLDSNAPGVLYDTELAGVEEETSLAITYDFAYTSDQPAILQIIAPNYVERIFRFDLLSQTQTFNVSVAPDPNV